jgi:hypothetical protein
MVTIYTTSFDIKRLHFAHIVYLYVSYESYNKLGIISLNNINQLILVIETGWYELNYFRFHTGNISLYDLNCDFSHLRNNYTSVSTIPVSIQAG